MLTINTPHTIQTINKYYNLLGLDREPTDDERAFMHYVELDLAKGIISDFGEDFARKLARVIMAVIE